MRCLFCDLKLPRNGAHSSEECLERLKLRLEITVEALQAIQDETECVLARELATDALEALLE